LLLEAQAGGLPPPGTMRSLELLGRAVVPQLKKRERLRAPSGNRALWGRGGGYWGMAASSVVAGSFCALFHGYTCTALGRGLLLVEEGVHAFWAGPCEAKISLIRCASKAWHRRLF